MVHDGLLLQDYLLAWRTGQRIAARVGVTAGGNDFDMPNGQCQLLADKNQLSAAVPGQTVYQLLQKVFAQGCCGVVQQRMAQ